MKFLGLLMVFVAAVSGDVSLTKPTTAQTFTVSGGLAEVDLAWSDSGSPAISSASAVTIILCTGSNTDITAVKTLASGDASMLTDGSYSAKIDAAIGASGVYFIQIYTTYGAGHSIHYTNRFSLSGMTGSQKASGAVSQAPPAAEVQDSASNTAAASASFTIPYTQQSGKTKYAPMQMQPGSTVTATTWTRKFPTSAVTYFTSASPSPNAFTTNTPGWSYTKTSLVNYASGLGTPTAWYLPSKVIKQATLYYTESGSIATAKQKRFWDFDD